MPAGASGNDLVFDGSCAQQGLGWVEAGRGGVPDAPHTTQHRRPCGDALLGQAVMHVGGCQQAEAGGMLLGGLPGKKTWRWAQGLLIQTATGRVGG